MPSRYIWCSIILFALPACADETIPIPKEKDRQFDFWVGEWQVQNRHLNADGSWRDGGQAQARISRALCGDAILEQWNGQGALSLRGFSLRTYDPEQARWEIVLNWHGGAPSSFSYMVGEFDESKGEFFPPAGPKTTRFTFSKAKPNSCQWDQATSSDGTQWKTDWIMSFTRTGPAHELNANNLPIAKPHPSVQGKFPETRQLDRIIGVWKGAAERLRDDGTWENGTATRRVSSMIDGYGLLQMTEYSWGEQSIAALSFNLQQSQWLEVGMCQDEPDCHWIAGSLVGNQLRLDEQPSSNNGVSHVWSNMKEDSYDWARERTVPGEAKPQVSIRVHFERASPEGKVTEIPTVTTSPQSAAQAALRRAQGLLQQQKFAEAESQLQALVADDASNLRAHFLLGYAQHIQKKYSAAVASYERAKNSPVVGATARYNLACIHSIEGNADLAIEQLQAAIAAGFQNLGQLEGDTDFDNIRSDPRFQALLPNTVEDDDLFVEQTEVIHQWRGEAPGDQFGWTARKVGDWDQDGILDFVATAPTHQGRGKVYVYSSATGQLLMKKAGQSGEQFGNSAVGCGDVNRDGTLDLLVGAPNNPNAAGNAYVFSGVDGSQLHHFQGTEAGDQFGYEVSEVGDIDADGHADLLVGAANGKGKQAKSGKVIVYSGKTGSVLFEIPGERSGDAFGNAVAVHRQPNGVFMIAVGAKNAGPSQRGRVYVYRVEAGKPELAFKIDGDANSVNLGQMFISFPGDVDQDGLVDIYASDFSDSTGIRGGGKIVIASARDGRRLLEISGQVAGEGLGTSPSDAGDVNGDGVGDLIIGAWQNNKGAPSGGKVYLYDGKSGELLRGFTCRQPGDTLGFDACGIGDVNGDGAIDFLLTSAWSNVGGPKTGRVFIVAGKDHSSK